ncbi:helitron_like_N domain-containing protein [Trichonephila inaurata madagascariensis]|uniref:Helitron_like_N domain-containing protein n=1 Tax=Trichonephila inaurata madagascariensis TaxID=2747483 RepID=A0A8X6IRQ8_9ARAC|nr:helitron_like_N domain-containing protein [Trichonephila inaurata madagascariensis]
MPMRKRGSLGRKTVKSKAVEHTSAEEAPDEKRARLQADQVRYSLARAAETPKQYQYNVVLNNGWTPTFKVQGQVYHHAGSLHPANAEDSKYLQIYFLGEDEQVQRRLDLLNSPVDRNIVLKLQRILHQHNSYVRSFKMTAEIMDHNIQVDYRIKIPGKAPFKEHKGRFNAPSVSEVTIMMVVELADRRDIGSDATLFAVANEMQNRLDEVTTYQQGRLVAVRQCDACSTFPSIKGIQQLVTWQYNWKEAKENTMNQDSQQHI